MKAILKLGCVANMLMALMFSLSTQAASCTSGGEYSDWMERLYRENSNTRLRDMTIPGSHDAASFSIKSVGVVKDVAVTQSRDLCQQAKDGIRYFDLRVKNDVVNNTFTVVHGIIRGADLPLVLDPLYEFAKSHPKEILILDFQELTDITAEVDAHRFNDYFIGKFADRLIPRISFNASNIRIADAWNMNRNIIVLAGNRQVVDSSNYYWDRNRNIDSPWANAATVEDLKIYQDSQFVNYQNTNKFYVSQMQLTFMGSGNIISKLNSLKRLAAQANTYLSQWMLSYEIEQGLVPNIIMVDYYERWSKVVETSLALNLRRKNISLAATKTLFPTQYGAIYPLFVEVPFRQLKNGKGKCLDIEKRSIENGTEIHQWSCHDADSQRWHLDPKGYLRSKLDFNKCATVADTGDNYARVEIWDCNEKLSQRWSEYGDHGLRSQFGKQYFLDIKGGWGWSGIPAHLRQYNGNDSQRWYWQ
jgi:hypothetical protein